MTPFSYLVKASKLETQFHSDPEYTQHVHNVCGNTRRQRSVQKEERWKRERRLGRGSFGDVWLEQCVQGDSEGKVRAVKEVQKREVVDYHRELEAIALFSHKKYERCFVKSFGWYDNSDSIFITMEYIPDGDLHKCLKSSLPEDEGQHIVFQILEGLDFMHDNGFAHRDLKPANILVLCKGPDWWVKIADFGISKRAIEGLTAFRTLTGTPAFTAPEILGFFQPGDRSHDTYTNAVDIWSLGVITYLILTGETLFRDQRRLGQYVAGSFEFPSGVLLANKVSGRGCDFVENLMAPRSEDRPGAKECLQHLWLGCPLEGAAPENQRTINISKSMPTLLNDSDSEPSASWSTRDPISAYKAHNPTGVFTGKTVPAPEEAIALPGPEPATQTHPHIANKPKGHPSPTPMLPGDEGEHPPDAAKAKEEAEVKLKEAEAKSAEAEAAAAKVKEEADAAAAAAAAAPPPAPERKAPIRFEDAVGRKFRFPFHLCSKWSGMERLINQAFLHVEVIGPHIREGHYDLIGPNGEIILPEVWETVIKPNWTITMHMWPMPEPLKPVEELPPPPPEPSSVDDAIPNIEDIVIVEKPKLRGRGSVKSHKRRSNNLGAFSSWMMGGKTSIGGKPALKVEKRPD